MLTWDPTLDCLRKFFSERTWSFPEIHTPDQSPFQSGGRYGWCRPGKVYVYRANCTKPNQGYSWPGSRSDRTEVGVLAHEFGHATDFALHKMYRGPPRWKFRGEPRPTGYATIPGEDFAESFRIFFLNPDLLHVGRPRRYAWLCELVGEPELTPWREVMHDAPVRFINMCERWLPAPCDGRSL